MKQLTTKLAVLFIVSAVAALGISSEGSAHHPPAPAPDPQDELSPAEFASAVEDVLAGGPPMAAERMDCYYRQLFAPGLTCY